MLVSGPEPRVWHNNLRFKSNLGYISDPSARDHRRLPEDLSLSLFLSLPLISLSLSLSHLLTHSLIFSLFLNGMWGTREGTEIVEVTLCNRFSNRNTKSEHNDKRYEQLEKRKRKKCSSEK